MQNAAITRSHQTFSPAEGSDGNLVNKQFSVKDIRRRFISYYQSENFQVLPRASLLHPSIPMSFVMSAGLAQVEMSLSVLPEQSGKQFILVQDCFRHFDLDRVGLDNRHLSLFQMPGAFVFGENAKQSTIHRMWEVATQEFQINPERIWVSYFSGGTVAGNVLPADQCTYETWCSIGVSPQHIVGLGTEDNYWQQTKSLGHIDGQPRKCGPNTELFYDFGSHRSCRSHCRPGCNCGRFLEFSNSLFITYEFTGDVGELVPLATPFTETVIGTERVAAILQNVSSVFEIAEYSTLIGLVKSYSEATDLPLNMVEESEKIIVDHAKALCFLVADGAPSPGKNGRERIIKLLIRRIIARMQILNISEELLWLPLLNTVIEQYELDTLTKNLDLSLIEHLMEYIESEAKRFHLTIQRGYKKMAKAFLATSDSDIEEQMVDLEKNWGLPLPLMIKWLHGKEIPFSTPKYYSVLEKWRSEHI